MKSIDLWGIVLPRQTNFLGKSAQTLRIDSQDKPLVKRLEWCPDQGMVVVTVEVEASDGSGKGEVVQRREGLGVHQAG